MKRRITLKEQKSKARAGFFWEWTLGKWIHFSQVDTPQKARRYLERQNPIKVVRLANRLSCPVVPRLGVLKCLFSAAFMWSVGVWLVIAFAIPAVIGGGTTVCEFYEQNKLAAVIMFFPIYPVGAAIIALLFKVRRIDLADASWLLQQEAQELKNGLVNDDDYDTRSFQE